MKKLCTIFLCILITLSLVGCSGSDQKTSVNQPDVQSVNTENNEKQLQETDEAEKEKLKADAVRADFVEINGHYEEVKGKSVYLEGEISSVDYDKVFDEFANFTLSQEEGNGFGMYKIQNIENVEGLKDGDYVRVYGKINEPGEDGMPRITAWIIEQK